MTVENALAFHRIGIHRRRAALKRPSQDDPIVPGHHIEPAGPDRDVVHFRLRGEYRQLALDGHHIRIVEQGTSGETGAIHDQRLVNGGDRARVEELSHHHLAAGNPKILEHLRQIDRRLDVHREIVRHAVRPKGMLSRRDRIVMQNVVQQLGLPILLIGASSNKEVLAP